MDTLRRRLYLLAALDEIGPLLWIYTLLFLDHGVSSASISGVFVLWAAIGVVLEVPSGALADRVDRRALMAWAYGFRAAGIAVWLVWPGLAGVVVGAALWAVHTAVASGTWEALIYDEVSAHGDESAYAPLMARVGQFHHVGAGLSALSATGLLALGVSLPVLGWITVALNFVCMPLVLVLPRAAAQREDDELSYGAWWSTLKQGVSDASSMPSLRRWVVVGLLLEGHFVLDEYVSILGEVQGAPESWIPVLVGAVFVGVLLGGELAARMPTMPNLHLGGLLAGSAVITGGILALQQPWSAAGIGVAYLALNASWVISDARFQHTAPDETRATVSSVRALGANLVSMALFVGIGAACVGDDPTLGLLATTAGLFLAACLLAFWAPRSLLS